LAKHDFLHNISLEKDLDFIAILETNKNNFLEECLDNFCGGKEFLWHWIPPNGRSGGILIGVNMLVFEVQSCLFGEFFIKLHLKNKDDSFRWVLMAMYGVAQPEDKDRFLAEWVNACSEESLPLMVGGDFNIIRNPSEKIMIDLMVDGLHCSMLASNLSI
jgi:hypothetical protein